MRGVVIAGTHSGCGKTTVTLGLLAALKKKGLTVQAFKAGPDFIDSGLHRIITGRPSRNLDLWMCGENYVKECYARNSSDADLAVVEGVMGLYDGTLSTASLAARLDLPVVLVIDSYGMAETAGALVKGFAEYASEEKIELAGVIFNRVASGPHYDRLCAGVRNVRVLGYLPRELEFEIPHRHLGLTVAEENPIAGENIDKLANAVLQHIDVDGLMGISRKRKQVHRAAAPGTSGLSCPIIAVAYDRAFCFYYEDNLDLLRDAGAEIVSFSPLADAAVPEGADAVYIGGGYPELYAPELSVNKSMINAIATWAASGKPLYAECGGLMYLSRGIHDFEGNFFGMAGVFPFETRMKKGRSKLGYREILLREDCIMGKKGATLRGHEFHYSEIVGQLPTSDSVIAACPQSFFEEGFPTSGNDKNGAFWANSRIYSVKNGSGQELHGEGYRYKQALASYIHIHFGSNPGIAKEFVTSCREKGN
ncbi:MAG: cobyrinate a,c-diamide synthase [Thermodesulfovibrionales bacterium]